MILWYFKHILYIYLSLILYLCDLIELSIIISIIGILFAIATPAYSRYVKKVKEEVCKVNCEQVERAYEAYLVLENIENSGVVFEEFMKEYGINLCPEHGIVTYVDGSVKCSVHTKDESEDDEVPFLWLYDDSDVSIG